MSIGNPDYSRYTLAEHEGWLRLRPTSTPLDAATSPTFVARRQTELRFSATALIDASHLAEGSQAGITAHAAPLNHDDVIIERKDGKLLAKSNIRVGALSHDHRPIELKDAQAYIRISSDKDYYYMQVSAEGKSFTTLSKMDHRHLSTEVIGGFTGVMLGLFAQGDDGYADFD